MTASIPTSSPEVVATATDNASSFWETSGGGAVIALAGSLVLLALNSWSDKKKREQDRSDMGRRISEEVAKTSANRRTDEEWTLVNLLEDFEQSCWQLNRLADAIDEKRKSEEFIHAITEGKPNAAEDVERFHQLTAEAMKGLELQARDFALRMMGSADMIKAKSKELGQLADETIHILYDDGYGNFLQGQIYHAPESRLKAIEKFHHKLDEYKNGLSHQ